MRARFALTLGAFFILSAPPAWAGDLNQQGLDLFRAGRFQEAINAYQQALEAQPDYPVALNNLGIAQYRLGRYAEAEISFKQAMALKADYVQPVINLGLVYFRTGRYLPALQQYWAAKRIDPYYTKLRVTKRKAEELVEEELDQHPDDPRLLQLKARLEGTP